MVIRNAYESPLYATSSPLIKLVCLPKHLLLICLSFAPESFSWYVGYAASAFPLDMSQYKRLFSTTRIPCAVKDELVTYEPSRHIAVLRNGYFYVFYLIKDDIIVKIVNFLFYLVCLISWVLGYIASTAAWDILSTERNFCWWVSSSWVSCCSINLWRKIHFFCCENRSRSQEFLCSQENS